MHPLEEFLRSGGGMAFLSALQWSLICNDCQALLVRGGLDSVLSLVTERPHKKPICSCGGNGGTLASSFRLLNIPTTTRVMRSTSLPGTLEHLGNSLKVSG